MPRRTRRELVGKQEEYERFVRQRELKLLARQLWRQRVRAHEPAHTPDIGHSPRQRAGTFLWRSLGARADRSVL